MIRQDQDQTWSLEIKVKGGPEYWVWSGLQGPAKALSTAKVFISDLAGLVLCAWNPEVLSQELQGRPCLLLFIGIFSPSDG